MSDITKSGIVLTYGANTRREPGRVHDELHAPCGCAFHDRPAPHWHPCPAHSVRLDSPTPPLHEEGVPVPAEIFEAALKVKKFFKAHRLSGSICGLEVKS